MEDTNLFEKVQGLTDLELAVLLSLMAGQQCLIETDQEAIQPLGEELQLIAWNTFGLSPTVVHCSETITLDQLHDSILVPKAGEGIPDASAPEFDSQVYQSSLPNHAAKAGRYGKKSRSTFSAGFADDQTLANIIILKNLCLAIPQVQIQILELLRAKRIITHTAVYTAPKSFAMIILQPSTERRLNKHLNDHLFFSHYYDPDDGLINLEEDSDRIEDDRASVDSVVHRATSRRSPDYKSAQFQPKEIRHLIDLTHNVTVNAEIKVYVQNIITFLRLHRAIGGGVTSRATHHFDLLIKCLAPLHGLKFVTPSLVALGARKIYPHRLELASASSERSMQYGSDLASVAAFVRECTPKSVIEDVLASVEAPL